ncbi:MAG: ABC transporter transmembrane domain-containing protein, partial [Caulobacteraceae bacterium]
MSLATAAIDDEEEIRRPGMDQYDDEETGRARALGNREVLAFVASYWKRRRWRVAATILVTLISIRFETLMPQAASALVDVTAKGPAKAGGAWQAWAFFVGVYVAYAVIRNVGIRTFWNPLAAHNMEEMTNEAFQNVQSFSSDWHADTFGGATVRRITRAMWGYDTISDCVVMFIGPALIVLLALSAQMLLRWPVIGAFSLAMVTLYIVSNVLFSNYYVLRANRRSVALDSRIGGALADSISSNPTVKGFGAEPREEARIATVTRDWRKATLVTWNR